MQNTIQLLKTVRATMDSIDVRGVDNQDKFVGCALSIQNVIRKMEQIQKEIQENSEKNQEVKEQING